MNIIDFLKLKNPELLTQALTHTSALRGQERIAAYERLEFLGDAVLGLIVAESLSNAFPEATEGQMSRWRAALVSTENLAAVFGAHPQMNEMIIVGPGQGLTDAILADVFESLVGAVYIDGGLEAAKELISAFYKGIDRQRLETLIASSQQDAKTELQERTQAAGMGLPIYRMVAAEGPAHRPTFAVQVELSEKILGTGQGSSKKAAEQLAARRALVHLQNSKEASHE